MNKREKIIDLLKNNGPFEDDINFGDWLIETADRIIELDELPSEKEIIETLELTHGNGCEWVKRNRKAAKAILNLINKR